MDRSDDQRFMREALRLAEHAAREGEIPVGAVLVMDNTIVGRGANQTIALNDCTAHAEIMALRDAGARLNQHRFADATLYCTLEPCAMCAGAMLHARIARLVIAADDPKAGAAGSVLDVLDLPALNHRVLLSSGLMEEEASALLTTFFARRRDCSRG
ncbi:MAG: tRNA adenosine(34) deaminase TadA [Pseudomonadota bacterium]